MLCHTNYLINNNADGNVGFLVIGFSKCGTTTLDKYLRDIPGLSLPSLTKEVHFFDRYYDRGTDWYHSKFTQPGIRGEVTPGYSKNLTFLERIAKYNPQIKIIVLLRNPVTRIHSHYKHVVQNYGYDKGIVRYVNDSLQSKETMYLDILNNTIRLFSREQVQIVLFESLIQDPAIVLKDLTRFLGIDWNKNTFRPKHGNRSQLPRNRWLYTWLKNLSRELHKKDQPWPVHVFKRLGLKKLLLTESSFEALPPDLYQDIQDKYQVEMHQLSDLLGLNLQEHWAFTSATSEHPPNITR